MTDRDQRIADKRESAPGDQLPVTRTAPQEGRLSPEVRLVGYDRGIPAGFRGTVLTSGELKKHPGLTG